MSCLGACSCWWGKQRSRREGSASAKRASANRVHLHASGSSVHVRNLIDCGSSDHAASDWRKKGWSDEGTMKEAAEHLRRWH